MTPYRHEFYINTLLEVARFYLDPSAEKTYSKVIRLIREGRGVRK